MAPLTGKVLFVNRFYAPDLSATSQILTDVATGLASRGHHVIVYASRMSYDARTTYIPKETLHGVQIHRIWSTKFGRKSTAGRAVDYFTFYVSIVLTLLFSLSRNDILIAKTDPPILSVPLGVVTRVRRAKLVNWLQDIFPEVALELGMGAPDGLLFKLLKKLRNLSLRRADVNVAIGHRMSKVINSLGVQPDRICVIENFVDDEAIVHSVDHSLELRSKWGFSDSDFIVGYSGNLGRAHDIETILAAAERLRDAEHIKFVFIGSGHKHEHLVRQIANRKLTNIFLKPYQPRSQLQQSLALPNLHWASLTPSLEGYIVPSKLYGIAAAGRPLLMIGTPDGEIGQILKQYLFGKCIPPGQGEDVAAFILWAQSDPETMAMMGERARAFIDHRASKSRAMERWDELVQRLTTTS